MNNNKESIRYYSDKQERFVESQFKECNIPWNAGKHPIEETRKRMLDADKARYRREGYFYR